MKSTFPHLTTLRNGVLMLTVLLALTGCGGGDTTKPGNSAKPGTATKPAESSAKSAETPLLTLGQPGRSGAFEIAVTGVEKPTEWINSAPAGQQYIVVKIKVTNISDKPDSIGAGSFGCVQDESGNRGSHARSTGIKTNPDTFGAADIKPGDTFAGSIIFTIPSGMAQTELHYTVGYALKPSLRFEIKL